MYHFERSHIIEYLSERGWQVSPRTAAELHADNGFDYPDDEVAAAFADMTYLHAALLGWLGPVQPWQHVGAVELDRATDPAGGSAGTAWRRRPEPPARL